MAKVSDFLSYVLPFVPGCSEPLAIQYIRDTCRDFATRTHTLQQALDPVNLVQGVAAYEMEPPFGTEVVTINKAWLGSNLLHVINGDQANAAMFNPTLDGTPGTPSALMQTGGNEFILNTPPEKSEAAALTLRVSLRPTRTTDAVDDMLFRDYAFEIAQGAIGRLQRIPAQPFSDPNSAMTAEFIYQAAVNKAKNKAYRAFGRTSATVQMRPFA